MLSRIPVTARETSSNLLQIEGICHRELNLTLREKTGQTFVTKVFVPIIQSYETTFHGFNVTNLHDF